MYSALLLLGVLGTTCALPDGLLKQLGNETINTENATALNYSKDPRNFVAQDGSLKQLVNETIIIENATTIDYDKDPRIPQFKLPAFDPRNIIPCSKRNTKVTLAPGESAIFQSPNYPADYNPKSKCKWEFKSTEDITISCSDFITEGPNKRGKCKDKLKIGRNIFCGTLGDTLGPYEGGTTIKVFFKSNRKKQYSGFSCTATAKFSTTTDPNPGVSTTAKPTTTAKPVPGSCKCGQANRATRIVNGVETEVNEYPWQAGLVYYGTSQVLCGASVIGSKHVLTAAHCTQAIKDYNINYQVLVGAHRLSSPASSQLRFDATGYTQHSQYDTSSYDTDISIIELSGSISFTSSEVRPICLPNNDANAYDSVTATVAGWGALAYQGDQPDVLMQVDVPTMTNTKCLSYYPGGITDNMLCAGYEAGGKDSCQGDSGGPLIYSNSGSCYTQIGVVSWGNKCAEPKFPGVYVRVSKYLSWIATNSASSDTCSPC